MTREALAASAAGALFFSSFIHLPYHPSENPMPQNTFRYTLAQEPSLRRLIRQFPPRRAARHVRLVVLHHVPNDRRQPTHDRHAGDL